MIEIVSHEELQFGALKGVHTGDIYRFTIPLIVLSTLVVALRVYVRGFLTRTFSLSEWLILPAYALFLTLCISVILVATWSFSKDALEKYPRIVKLSVADSIIFVFAQILIKLSVGAYFYRIVHQRWQRYIISISLIVFVIFELVLVFTTTFQCGKPTVMNLVTGLASGRCISWSRFVGPLTYLAVCLNAALDWIFVLAALPVISSLRRMPPGEVACVCFLFFLATGASVLSLVRIKFIGDGSQPAVLQNNKHFAVLSLTEAGVAIITVSMATLHPLFQLCLRRKADTRLPATRDPEDLPAEEEKKVSATSSEGPSTRNSGPGRVGILPTMFDTELDSLDEDTTYEHLHSHGRSV